MDYKFGHKRKYSGDELKLLKLSAETNPDRHVEKKGADSHIKFHGDQLDFLTKNISFRMKGKPSISKEMKQQHTAKIDKLEKIKIKREKQLDLAKNGIKKFNAQLSKVKNDLTPKSIVRKQADAHIKKLIKRKDEIKAKISNTKKEIQTLKKDFDIKKIKIKKTRDLKIDKTLKDRNNTALRKLQETIQKTLKETFTKKKSRLLSRKMTNSFGDKKRGHRHHLHPNQKLTIMVPDKIKIRSYKPKKIANPAHKTFHKHEKTRLRKGGRRFNKEQDAIKLRAEQKRSVEKILKSLKLPDFIQQSITPKLKKIKDVKGKKAKPKPISESSLKITSSDLKKKGKRDKKPPKRKHAVKDNFRDRFDLPEPKKKITVPDPGSGWGGTGTKTITNPAWISWNKEKTTAEAVKKAKKAEEAKKAAEAANKPPKRYITVPDPGSGWGGTGTKTITNPAWKIWNEAETMKKKSEADQRKAIEMIRKKIEADQRKAIETAKRNEEMRKAAAKRIQEAAKKAAEAAKKAEEAAKKAAERDNKQAAEAAKKAAKKAAEEAKKAAEAVKKATSINRRVVSDPPNRGSGTTGTTGTTATKITKMGPTDTALKGLFKALHDQIEHFRK